jgi:spore germination cell wall hydrolase CwlJ-like protein
MVTSLRSKTIEMYADVVFLALMAWREARGESTEARAAVMHVVLTRMANPGWWGRDVPGVLFKRWQFTSLTGHNDPQLTVWPKKDDPIWVECLKLADNAMSGALHNPATGADSYHDISIGSPDWAAKATHIRDIGRLKFYKVRNA